MSLSGYFPFTSQLSTYEVGTSFIRTAGIRLGKNKADGAGVAAILSLMHCFLRVARFPFNPWTSVRCTVASSGLWDRLLRLRSIDRACTLKMICSQITRIFKICESPRFWILLLISIWSYEEFLLISVRMIYLSHTSLKLLCHAPVFLLSPFSRLLNLCYCILEDCVLPLSPTLSHTRLILVGLKALFLHSFPTCTAPNKDRFQGCIYSPQMSCKERME